MFDVFISHFTHDDSHDAFNAVHAYLSAKHIAVFNPTTHLAHVKEINKAAMQSAVKRSTLVIAALSDGFFESIGVRGRGGGGEGGGIKVIPVFSGDDHAAKQIDKWVDKLTRPHRVRLHLPRERARRPQQAEPRVGQEDA